MTERPGTAGALKREVTGLLAVPGTWIWRAERDGEAFGMLCAERPESAAWIAPMVRGAPVAYLLLIGVARGQRGSGVGAAMIARLQQEIEAAGVARCCTTRRSTCCPRRSGASRATGRYGPRVRPRRPVPSGETPGVPRYC